MLIGVTGMYAAGKDTFSDFLQNKGFIPRSLSDEIRKECHVQNLPPSRENLIQMGTRLREKEGNAVLAKRALAGANANVNYTITSIRNPAEVDELKKSGNFFLVFVDAPLETRFERARKRNREGDPPDFASFKRMEEYEHVNVNTSSQQLLKVKEMADFTLTNEGTFDEFYSKIDELLDKLHYIYKRPAWDDYFMELTHAVAKRATCDRGRSGCVIVKDKRILTTGYVGSPPGQPHCDEAGHLLKRMTHEDGSTTMHCVRTVHAEQNAIVQAGKLGISLEGATLYCKMTPCRTCAMLILGVGIARVVCEKKYRGGVESENMLTAGGVQIEHVNSDVEKYKNQ